MEWHELPSAVRREVLALAKNGRRHPDPQVSEAAYRWAAGQPQSRVGRTFDVGMELFSGIFAPGSADLSDMRERFVAHRVAALGPPESSTSKPGSTDRPLIVDGLPNEQMPSHLGR